MFRRRDDDLHGQGHPRRGAEVLLSRRLVVVPVPNPYAALPDLLLSPRTWLLPSYLSGVPLDCGRPMVGGFTLSLVWDHDDVREALFSSWRRKYLAAVR